MPLQTAQYSIGTASVEILSPQTNPVQMILHNANKSSNTFIWFDGSERALHVMWQVL